ncbi:hypothetical protein [Novosphingobium sp. NBM11]|uniref:hypothetical protein n=1 Tax=Novosphingobium sp. NBM11 TaxID=2596914 RepID=UPI0021072754|nr:hypothetical protein [Novosphingobium sp. NBM11]
MVEEHSEVGKEAKSQTAHRLKMNPTAFKTLSLALHNLSCRELELCSPRRLLTTVLAEPRHQLFHIPHNELDAICHLDNLIGEVQVNIRVDSVVNARLREFRDQASNRLGRTVSVIEAIYACAHVMNEGL